MTDAATLSWTIARHLAGMPGGTAFTATSSAALGVMLARRLFDSRLRLWGHGGAYDPDGILSIHARYWLFNRASKARVTLPQVFETQSEPHVLMASPAQVDGACNANLSGIGDSACPKVAFGGTRGLPDARTVFFVLPHHSPRQLVEQVDFVSTCAANRSTPSLLFTGLCVMRWSHERGCWSLLEVAPDCDPETLKSRTGFRFDAAGPVAAIAPPPQHVLDLLETFDPLGVRELDLITDRGELLDAYERLYAAEVALVESRHSVRAVPGTWTTAGGER